MEGDCFMFPNIIDSIEIDHSNGIRVKVQIERDSLASLKSGIGMACFETVTSYSRLDIALGK